MWVPWPLPVVVLMQLMSSKVFGFGDPLIYVIMVPVSFHDIILQSGDQSLVLNW